MKKIAFAIITMLATLTLASGCKKTPQSNDPEYVKHISDKSSDPLGDIAKDSKGKVTLVNLWATWCHPCLQAHEDWKPLKEEERFKDVRFVYVTSSTSPLETWQELIKEIKGEHYYITSDQMSMILEAVGSSSYPTFIIIGKDGSVQFICTGNRPEIITKLEDLLK